MPNERPIPDLVYELQRIQRDLANEGTTIEEKVEKFDKYVRFLYLIGGFIVVITAWVLWVQFSLLKIEQAQTKDDTNFAAHSADIRRIDSTATARFSADDLLHAGMQARITMLERELESRKPAVDKVNEMWFLIERGIDPSEAYQRKHGAPKSP